MRMDGVDLLLGNDFQQQFDRLQIDYVDSTAYLTLGDLPLAAITSRVDTSSDTTVPSKIVTTFGTEIPAFSVFTVKTESSVVLLNILSRYCLVT